MIRIIAMLICSVMLLITACTSQSGQRENRTRLYRVVDMIYSTADSKYHDLDGTVRLHRLDTMYRVGDTLNLPNGDAVRIIN